VCPREIAEQKNLRRRRWSPRTGRRIDRRLSGWVAAASTDAAANGLETDTELCRDRSQANSAGFVGSADGRLASSLCSPLEVPHCSTQQGDELVLSNDRLAREGAVWQAGQRALSKRAPSPCILSQLGTHCLQIRSGGIPTLD